MFFDSWTGLGRVLIAGVVAYVALVAFLRVAGKRTLSKMNAFDLVVTVALGSSLATILLSKDVAILEGVTAFAVLIALQFVVTSASLRWKAVDRLVKSQPRMIFYRGNFLDGAMRRERVTEDEIRAAIREHGSLSSDSVLAVVIETTGTLSVIDDRETDASALHGVENAPSASA